MSDNTSTTDDTTTEDGTTDAAEQSTRPDRRATPDDTRQRMVRYAQWAAFALLCLVALVATARLYFAASATIETFVTRRYRPLFMAGFNLAVLLACGVGLSVLVRRLT